MGFAEEKVKRYLAAIKKDNKRINAVLHVNESALQEAKAIDDKVSKTGKKGMLYGYVIGVKSNINVCGLPASCASKTLETYKATYDATVIEKIKSDDSLDFSGVARGVDSLRESIEKVKTTLGNTVSSLKIINSLENGIGDINFQSQLANSIKKDDSKEAEKQAMDLSRKTISQMRILS